MDGSATVILKEKLALKSFDVVDTSSVDNAVEKSRDVKETFVTETMRVRSFQQISTAWEMPRA